MLSLLRWKAEGRTLCTVKVLRRFKMKVKLYDLDSEKVPTRPKSFRSIQMFRCPICLALTNKNQIRHGPYHQKDSQPICPSREEEWHKSLKRKLQLSYDEHPQSYKDELALEISALRGNFENDVIGIGIADYGDARDFPILNLSSDPIFSRL
jgi:hypothetical protein